MRSIGRFLFVFGLFGLGAFTLITRDFALVWQMETKDFPLPAWLAQLSGALLIVLAVAVLVNRCLAALPIFLAVVFIAPQFARSEPWGIGRAVSLAETVAAFCGAWVLARLPRQKVVQVLYGLCCIEFGLAHFKYAQYTATMIPGFIPGHLAMAYVTGAGHTLAGLSILTGLLATYGAIGEAAMLSSFVLLVHVPSLFMRVPWTTNPRFIWTELFWATTVTAGAWCMAAALQHRPEEDRGLLRTAADRVALGDN
jgi:uncharacterized membrane protein YphA (DoxX/SURF4 family)